MKKGTAGSHCPPYLGEHISDETPSLTLTPTARLTTDPEKREVLVQNRSEMGLYVGRKGGEKWRRVQDNVAPQVKGENEGERAVLAPGKQQRVVD